MAASPQPLRARVAELAAGLLALGFAVPVILAVGGAIRTRLTFPGDLEWMEGSTLVSALRVQQGLPIYGEPAGDYIPFIYPPLYAWILAGLGHVVPLGYGLGRAVSTVGSVVAGAALVFGARREGANWPLSLATLGLFAACWDDSGTFYDLVRTDGLSIGLLSWVLVLAPHPHPRASVVSGLLLAVAFMAKQHVALLGVPLLLWTWRTHGRARAVQFAAASVGGALLFVAAMALFTEGRFLVWLAVVPAAHGQSLARLIPGAQLELWRALPITTTAALLALPLWARKRWYWALVAGCTLIVVSLMRGHTGGYLNVLIPALWLLGLLPIVAAGAVGTATARTVAGVVVAAQCLCWNVDWSLLNRRLAAGAPAGRAWSEAQRSLNKFVPTQADVDAATALVEELRDLPDPILMPHGPWYAIMAGKRTSFSLITLWDIDHQHGVYEPDVAEIERAMAGDFASAVVPNDDLGHHFTETWVLDHQLAHRGPSTRTGWAVKLRTVYRPKGGAAEEQR